MKTSLLPLSSLMVLAMATPAFSAISLVDLDYYTNNGSSGVASHTIQATDLNSGAALNLTGGSKLVVSIAGEGSGNAANDNTVTSVTYGGVALTSAVQAGPTGRKASVWYLDLGAALIGTNFVVNYATDQEDLGFAAYVLAGTAAGFSSPASVGNPGASNALSITTLTANEFVVTTMTRNNFDNNGAAGIGVISPLTQVFYPDLGGASVAAAYRSTTAAGAYDLVINDSANNSTSFVAASFAAIPEPSSMALAGLTLAGLLLRRRR